MICNKLIFPNSTETHAKALVVDDDIDQRIMLQSVLINAGLEVKEANCGYKALELIENFSPDIVLMDVKMPGIDGIETCIRMRQLVNGQNIPIVLVTGLDDIDSIKRAFEADATDFITKPVNWTLLNHRIKYYLKSGKAIKALHRSESHLKNSQEVATIGSWEYDLISDETHVSEQIFKIFGDLANYKDNKNYIHNMVHHEDLERLMTATKRALSEGKNYEIDYRVIDTSGIERTIHEQAKIRYDINGKISGTYGSIQDITKRKIAENKIKHLAYFDPLTQLPNRVFFKKNASLMLASAEENNTKVAIMFIDLDNFKRVNDAFGHDIGDILLQKISNNLMLELRSNDCIVRTGNIQNDTNTSISRLGGDEFTVLLNGFNDLYQVQQVAKRIYSSICQNILVAEHDLVVTGSIGIAVYPDDGKDFETLLKHADIAMYEAKEKGHTGYEFYSNKIKKQPKKEISIEVKLRQALEKKHFQLYYQPQVSSLDGSIMGVEALIRWLDPDIGIINPSDFIPLAERCDIIYPISEWVLNTACHQAVAWQKLGLSPTKVSVNIASKQLKLSGLSELVHNALNDSGLEACYLVLEITENSLITETEEVQLNLNKLKDLGVSIAVDDFGTGYSSLSYLQSLPIDTIKIDKHFIDNITTNERDIAIVQAIITMAKGLGMNAIAEGAESLSQVKLLAEKGCHEVQGYYYSKPLPAEEIQQFFLEYIPENHAL